MALKPIQKPLFSGSFGPPPCGPEPSWIESCRFADNVWLAKGNDGRGITLDFSTLPTRHRLTCKYLLWAVEYEADTRTNTRKGNAVTVFQRYFYEFRRLVCFMADHGRTTISELCDADIRKYVRALVDDRETYTYSYAQRTGSLLDKLYKLGPVGSGVLPDGMLRLYAFKDVEQMIGVAVDLKPTPIMPENLARDIVNSAIEFLDLVDDIIFIYVMSAAYRSSKYYNGQANAEVSAAARAAYLLDAGQDIRFKQASDRVAGHFHLLADAPDIDTGYQSNVDQSVFLMARARVCLFNTLWQHALLFVPH